MVFPAYRSSVYAIESSVHRVDRENRFIDDISDAVVDIEVDADIDRSGAKGQCRIETYRDVINDGDWIAPHIIVTPEVGDEVQAQMGHYLIGTPEAEYRGTDAVHVQASGSDIVDMLAQAVLDSTFYTPSRGHVMSDISALIQMATMGSLGPNILTTGGFENEGAGWTMSTNITPAPTLGWLPGSGYSQTEGVNVARVVLPANAPVAGVAVLSTATQPVPTDSPFMSLSGYVLGPAKNHALPVFIEFHDGSGWMPASTRIFAGSTTSGVPLSTVWYRIIGAGRIPEGAVSFRVVTRCEVLISSTGQSASAFDDLQVRTCTGLPIAVDRIALPPSGAIATTRMQHVAGDTILQAINDRAASISHHGVLATMDGRITTRPSRDVASDSPSRTYVAGVDGRIMGSVRVERNASNRYNVVIAIKEDMESGVPMKAKATNTDADDQWSVWNMAPVTRVVTVQDAVDQAALQAEADTVLSRASMQDQLSMEVLPDPGLTVYDVIQVDGPDGDRSVGRWGVESLQWGMSATNPLVRIGARRTIRGS